MEKQSIGICLGLCSMKCSLECHLIMLMKSKLIYSINFYYREILFKNIMNDQLQLPDEISESAKNLLTKVSHFHLIQYSYSRKILKTDQALRVEPKKLKIMNISAMSIGKTLLKERSRHLILTYLNMQRILFRCSLIWPLGIRKQEANSARRTILNTSLGGVSLKVAERALKW